MRDEDALSELGRVGVSRVLVSMIFSRCLGGVRDGDPTSAVACDVELSHSAIGDWPEEACFEDVFKRLLPRTTGASSTGSRVISSCKS